MGEIVGYLGVLSPLIIAVVGAIVALIKMVWERNHPRPPQEGGATAVQHPEGTEANPAILQGQTIAPREWTWQDELRATQDRLEFIDACAEAFRDELLRQGVEPRDVLIKAGLMKVSNQKEHGA